MAISETAGSLGNEIGRRLAERLGYRFADREIIAKASERFGENVTDVVESLDRGPSVLVLDGGHPVGVLTRQDVLAFLAAKAGAAGASR